MTKQNRLIVYAVVIIAVLVFAWFGTPSQHFVPRGSFLSNGKTFAAVNPDSITLSQSSVPGATPLGYVSVELYSKTADASAVTSVEKMARDLAAKHGARNLVVRIFGQNPEDKSIVFQAEAVR